MDSSEKDPSTKINQSIQYYLQLLPNEAHSVNKMKDQGEIQRLMLFINDIKEQRHNFFDEINQLQKQKHLALQSIDQYQRLILKYRQQKKNLKRQKSAQKNQIYQWQSFQSQHLQAEIKINKKAINHPLNQAIQIGQGKYKKSIQIKQGGIFDINKKIQAMTVAQRQNTTSLTLKGIFIDIGRCNYFKKKWVSIHELSVFVRVFSGNNSIRKSTIELINRGNYPQIKTDKIIQGVIDPQYKMCINTNIQGVQFFCKKVYIFTYQAGINTFLNSLKTFHSLKSFSFYFRFPLLNKKQFHELKKVLQDPKINEVNIIIDPQYEQYQEKDHWLSDWMNAEGLKRAIYRKWDWN